MLLLLLGAGAYFQEALLNQLQLRQQSNEIESLLAAAQTEQLISEIKGRLRKAIEVQVDKETNRVKQFIKQNDTNGARQALKRAKEIKAQLDTLN